MAVAFGASNSPAAVTAASITSGNLTLSGSNLAITVGIVYNSVTEVVSSVTWSLGGGTGTEVISVRGGAGNSSFASVWQIPAPTAGTGTVTVNLGGIAVSWRVTAAWWTGADQTTPCPVADAKTSVAAQNVTTMTPSNLTANDVSFGAAGSAAENWSSVTANQLLLTNATTENTATGYSTGTTAVVFTSTGGPTDVYGCVAARIAAAASGETITMDKWFRQVPDVVRRKIGVVSSGTIGIKA